MSKKEKMPNFANAAEVISYLAGRYRHLGHSTFYRHRAEGKIRPQHDGTYNFRDVARYAKNFLKPLDETTLLKRSFEQELARRTARLQTLFVDHAPEIISTVSGDPGRAPDLVAYLSDLLSHDYAAASFNDPLLPFDESEDNDGRQPSK